MSRFRDGVCVTMIIGLTWMRSCAVRLCRGCFRLAGQVWILRAQCVACWPHLGGLLQGEGLQALLPLGRLGREEADEGEGVRGKRGPHDPRDHRARSRDGYHRDARACCSGYENGTRVAHHRHPRVAHHHQPLPCRASPRHKMSRSRAC
eukprot:1189469-Prorocentrum_minimum.AAC.1